MEESSKYIFLISSGFIENHQDDILYITVQKKKKKKLPKI